MAKIGTLIFSLFLSVAFCFFGCDKTTETKVKRLKVGMVLDTGGDTDRGYNEYSLKGARDAAEAAGIEFDYMACESIGVYERNIDKIIAEGADLVFTVGFALANATAKAALRYPDRHFVIMDYAYSPGNGCPGYKRNP
jgi:basic membrane protein A